MPFSLSLLVLPLCLHKDSRDLIAAGSRNHLLKITERSPQIVAGFAGRASSMLPYAFEGFGLLTERGCVTVQKSGNLLTVPDKVRKTVSGTNETRSCQRVARFVGKEFARIADRVTIYTTFGIRP